MQWLLLAALAVIDVSALKIGPPTTVTELDLGKLKGELRQLAWSPDGARFYIQTAEGKAPSEKLRHYIVDAAGGAPVGADQPPAWAQAYWSFKSARSAPGLPSLMIDVEQKLEKTKVGTGSGRPGSTGGGGLGDVGIDLTKTAEGQHQGVVRLMLLGKSVGEFVNAQAIPGVTFSWGPMASGAIAYTDAGGQLILLDQQKHSQTVSGVKEALLPAWSSDGTRLAWVQKSGRKKYTLVWSTVT